MMSCTLDSTAFSLHNKINKSLNFWGSEFLSFVPSLKYNIAFLIYTELRWITGHLIHWWIFQPNLPPYQLFNNSSKLWAVDIELLYQNCDKHLVELKRMMQRKTLFLSALEIHCFSIDYYQTTIGERCHRLIT